MAVGTYSHEEQQRKVGHAVSLFSVTAPPNTDIRIGSMDEQVAMRHLMKLLVVGDGSLVEWETRELHTEITCICPVKIVIALDPGWAWMR